MSDVAKHPDSNEMAVDRTWLAHERTLMSWIRTSASMISFGFTIYKFFQFETDKNASAKRGLLTPRDFALMMIGIGLVSLVAATISHHKELRQSGISIKGRHSLATLVAYLVSVFGILVLVATFFRN